MHTRDLLCIGILGAASMLYGTDGPNLIANSSFESSYLTSTGARMPTGWCVNHWGNSTATFIYPATPAYDGTSAVQVQMTSYTSGDAKWYPCAEISVSPGQTYHFFDHYIANVPTVLELQYRLSDGTYSWPTVANLPVASSYALADVTFTVPANAVGLVPYHPNYQNGTLTIDSFELHLVTTTPPPPPPPSSGGMVSLNLDDCFLDAHNLGMPIIDQAGIKTTQYVITDYTLGGFPAYCSVNQVLAMVQNGHEIGNHTRHHYSLSTLSNTAAQDQIFGAQQAFEQQFGLTPKTFAYPYGDYGGSASSAIVGYVAQAGFMGARSTDDGIPPNANTKSTNRFVLKRMNLGSTTQLADVQSAIDGAMADGQWLIFVIHHVNTTGDGAPYQITPSFLQGVVNYLVSKKIPVVTNAAALGVMSQSVATGGSRNHRREQ